MRKKRLKNEFAKRGPTAAQIRKAQAMARRVSARLLGLMEARTVEDK